MSKCSDEKEGKRRGHTSETQGHDNTQPAAAVRTLCRCHRSSDRAQLMRARRSTEVAPKCALRIFRRDEVLSGLSFTVERVCGRKRAGWGGGHATGKMSCRLVPSTQAASPACSSVQQQQQRHQEGRTCRKKAAGNVDHPKINSLGGTPHNRTGCTTQCLWLEKIDRFFGRRHAKKSWPPPARPPGPRRGEKKQALPPHPHRQQQ